MKSFFGGFGRRFFVDRFDPAGSYTGNYVGYEDDLEPEQDADDL